MSAGDPDFSEMSDLEIEAYIKSGRTARSDNTAIVLDGTVRYLAGRIIVDCKANATFWLVVAALGACAFLGTLGWIDAPEPGLSLSRADSLRINAGLLVSIGTIAAALQAMKWRRLRKRLRSSEQTLSGIVSRTEWNIEFFENHRWFFDKRHFDLSREPLIVVAVFAICAAIGAYWILWLVGSRYIGVPDNATGFRISGTIDMLNASYVLFPLFGAFGLFNLIKLQMFKRGVALRSSSR